MVVKYNTFCIFCLLFYLWIWSKRLQKTVISNHFLLTAVPWVISSFLFFFFFLPSKETFKDSLYAVRRKVFQMLFRSIELWMWFSQERDLTLLLFKAIKIQLGKHTYFCQSCEAGIFERKHWTLCSFVCGYRGTQQ